MDGETPNIERPPRRFDKLRIAWSVMWAVVALLLTAWWVRSYLVYERFIVYAPNGVLLFIAYSNKGVYILSNYPLLAPDANVPWWFLARHAFGTAVCLPFSLTVVFACVVSVLPWLLWSIRFSLRTLLVATTLVAVGLGLAIYATRR